MRFAPPNPLRIADRASGLNAPSVRSYNERLVLSLLLQNEGTTRLEIGEKTGLSAQTVSVIVRSLEQEGLVAKGEAQRGRVGPPTIPMMLNPEGAFSVGISFGTWSADVVVIDFVGGVRFHKAHPYSDLYVTGNAVPLQAAIEAAVRVVPENLRDRIAGIGLAVPDEATIGDELTRLVGPDLPGARARIEAAFGLPVFMQNDITAAASGESLFGVARSLSDFVFFYLGSRLHSRLILNHQIYNGKAGASYDVGLSNLTQALAEIGTDVVPLSEWPDLSGPADPTYRAWRMRVRARITESVGALLDFVRVQSVVLSTYAPAPMAELLRAEIAEALSGLDIQLGRGLVSPKAWGAASLPYHSRFMVQ
ncbi:sugar kinase [Kaistia algarum]|uniref:ROK family transcriptional regulator n=1 Tax=Kaistia algarum TaxID=2083279 RepID=UPI000CE86B77|nr:ROK family transcriptional regulator [Kaistia algarum]MCX5513989.1 ROK family transcriptional regulator [Kaistia algarum]PPE78043.1 sugar kinase [Kaistia algarum]